MVNATLKEISKIDTDYKLEDIKLRAITWINVASEKNQELPTAFSCLL